MNGGSTSVFDVKNLVALIHSLLDFRGSTSAYQGSSDYTSTNCSPRFGPIDLDRRGCAQWKDQFAPLLV